MTIREMLSDKTTLLESSREMLLQRLNELQETLDAKKSAQKETDTVLSGMQTYMGDCFPLRNGSGDTDWMDNEPGIISLVFAEAQEIAFEISLIENDINNAKKEIEKVLDELSLCTRGDIDSRTFMG